jgi:hypothetical protein
VLHGSTGHPAQQPAAGFALVLDRRQEKESASGELCLLAHL